MGDEKTSQGHDGEGEAQQKRAKKTPEEKVAEARERLEKAEFKLQSARGALALPGGTDAARADMQVIVTAAQAKVVECKTALRRIEVEAKYATAQERLRLAGLAVTEVELEGFTTPEAAEKFGGILASLVEELINLGATANTIEKRRTELANRVRSAVLANPTGWIAGEEDPEKKYLCWLSADGGIMVTLVDNPSYELPVDKLIELVGLADATKFLQVDYTAFRNDVANTKVMGKDGKPVTIDSLRDLRVRSERTKKVMAKFRGGEHVGAVVDVIAPELKEEFVEQLAVLGFDQAITQALERHGITRVGQVRCLSGDDLARIKGIGPARAAAIIRAVVQHRK